MVKIVIPRIILNQHRLFYTFTLCTYFCFI